MGQIGSIGICQFQGIVAIFMESQHAKAKRGGLLPLQSNPVGTATNQEMGASLEIFVSEHLTGSSLEITAMPALLPIHCLPVFS